MVSVTLRKTAGQGLIFGTSVFLSCKHQSCKQKQLLNCLKTESQISERNHYQENLERLPFHLLPLNTSWMNDQKCTMLLELSGKEFLEAASAFVDRCQDGGWKLSTDSKRDPLKSFVWKTETSNTAPDCSVDYHIVYCPSYKTPVLYMTAFDSRKGQSLKLSDCFHALKKFRFSQKIHPVLNIPFYHIHPCETTKLLQVIQENAAVDLGNYIAVWLSIYSIPLVTNALLLRLPSSE